MVVRLETGAPDAQSLVQRTQRVDLARSIPLGVLIPLETSVLLTIMVKHFDGGPLAKGLVAAASGFGLLVSPLLTSVARRLGWRVQRLSAVVGILGSLGFALAATGPMFAFVAGSIIGVASRGSVIPLITVTYQRNFSRHDRGRRVGRGLAVKVAVSAVAAVAMGSLLKGNLGTWRTVVAAGVLASLAGAVCDAMMPSAPLERVAGVRNRPWPHFHLLTIDRRLRLTLGAWMLMGFGNLMLLPLRVEYLAQPKYGVNADAAKIIALTVAVPAVVRLALLPFFGSLFDRLSFFSARIVVNLLFALYVAAFFTGTSDTGLIIGAITLGVANAGGDLMWSLWVTKFAPADRVADYMSLHTFFTGVRATLAPLLAFAVIGYLPLSTVAWLAAALMVASSLVLLPEARAERSVTK